MTHLTQCDRCGRTVRGHPDYDDGWMEMETPDPEEESPQGCPYCCMLNVCPACLTPEEQREVDENHIESVLFMIVRDAHADGS